VLGKSRQKDKSNISEPLSVTPLTVASTKRSRRLKGGPGR
jgi:hypothetical protein